MVAASGRAHHAGIWTRRSLPPRKQVWIWLATDDEREVLDTIELKRRDVGVMLRFMRRMAVNHGLDSAQVDPPGSISFRPIIPPTTTAIKASRSGASLSKEKSADQHSPDCADAGPHGVAGS